MATLLWAGFVFDRERDAFRVMRLEAQQVYFPAMQYKKLLCAGTAFCSLQWLRPRFYAHLRSPIRASTDAQSTRALGYPRARLPDSFVMLLI